MDEYDVIVRLGRALENVGVSYFLGGSMASSLQGEPRSTNDIDVVVDLLPGQVQALADALGADFEVDVESLKDEAKRRGSWNVFFMPLVTKIDLFILKAGDFDRSEFKHRRRVMLPAGESIWIKSPEDTVLRKLKWFQDGGGAASQQLRDVTRVLQVNRGALDEAYLREWAGKIGVTPLLEQAFAAATA